VRAAIYSRVSSEEQIQGYSIAAQQRAAHNLLAERGWTLVREYTDEGKSARSDDVRKRPQFRQMLADAEAGLLDVVVVHKFDRFARNLRVTLESLDVLSRANVAMVSITEQIDYSTPQGKLFLHMLAMLAQFFADNLSQEIGKGLVERKTQGFYNGVLAFGAIKDEETKLPIPHPTNYAGLLLAFELAGQGQSDAQIATALSAKGYRTTGNRGANLWRKDTVRRMLQNRFYLGELPIFEKDPHHKRRVLAGWMPGGHQAFVSQNLWSKAQAARVENRTIRATRSSARQVYGLTGLLRCGYCEEAGRQPATVQIAQGENRVRTYCYQRNEGLAACPNRGFAYRVYESQVTEWLTNLTLPDDAVDLALASMKAEQQEIPDGDLERKRLEMRLERLKDMYGWGDINRNAYLVERDQLQRKLQTLVPIRQGREDVEARLELIRNAADTWATLGQESRHNMAVVLFEKIVVKDARVVAIVPRLALAHLLPVWQSATV